MADDADLKNSIVHPIEETSCKSFKASQSLLLSEFFRTIEGDIKKDIKNVDIEAGIRIEFLQDLLRIKASEADQNVSYNSLKPTCLEVAEVCIMYWEAEMKLKNQTIEKLIDLQDNHSLLLNEFSQFNELKKNLEENNKIIKNLKENNEIMTYVINNRNDVLGSSSNCSSGKSNSSTGTHGNFKHPINTKRKSIDSK